MFVNGLFFLFFNTKFRDHINFFSGTLVPVIVLSNILLTQVRISQDVFDK
jgi:hypothetical protein